MGKKRVGNFRSNIFGGFNRRDVIGYIEYLHKKLDNLQKENELLRSKLPAEQPEDKAGKESQNKNLKPEPEEPKREPDGSDISSDSEPDEMPDEPSELELPDEATGEQAFPDKVTGEQAFPDEVGAEPDLPDETDLAQQEEISPDNTEHVENTEAATADQASPVQSDTEQKAKKNYEVSVSASKKTIKVRKKTKR